MSMLSTRDIYQLYLDGIRSYSTSVVEPDLFNRIINDAQDVFVNENIPAGEMGQRQIDNLRVLLSEKILNGSGLRYDLPVDYIRKNALFVMFSSVPKDVCDVKTGEWYSLNTARGDSFSRSTENPYRKPSARMRYYQIIQDGIYLYVGDAQVDKVKMLYYGRPRKIYFDAVNPPDRDPIPDVIPPYNPGGGSIRPIFEDEQCRMIVSIAVRITIENKMNPRYKSYLQEEMLRERRS